VDVITLLDCVVHCVNSVVDCVDGRTLLCDLVVDCGGLCDLVVDCGGLCDLVVDCGGLCDLVVDGITLCGWYNPDVLTLLWTTVE